jgi:PRTRC genetic system protein C
MTTANTELTPIKTQLLAREFYFHGIRLPDPNPDMTVDQVRDVFTPTYPEIATASLVGPEDHGDVVRFTFSRAIGSKS